ncbi:hypothetical protein TNCV_2922761 [Trichonephila clavipes]|nr:hypothetical protein TNCV_2922761 [Trichonephila clavipes]
MDVVIPLPGSTGPRFVGARHPVEQGLNERNRKIFYTVSSLCLSSLIATTGKQWLLRLPETHNQMFSIGERSGERSATV